MTLVNVCIYFREVKYQNRLAGPGLMCLESQWRGVRMSAPCQTCPRQKLDAKFKQGSKLNFNKPLTSFLLPLPEKHNAWLDRLGRHRVSSYKMLQLENISRILKCSCLKIISSELYAWPKAIVKLIWLSGVTNKTGYKYKLWTRSGAVVGMSCSLVSLSCQGCDDTLARWQTPCAACHDGAHM